MSESKSDDCDLFLLEELFDKSLGSRACKTFGSTESEHRPTPQISEPRYNFAMIFDTQQGSDVKPGTSKVDESASNEILEQEPPAELKIHRCEASLGLHEMFIVSGTKLETLEDWYANLLYDIPDPNERKPYTVEEISEPFITWEMNNVYDAIFRENSKQAVAADVRGMGDANKIQRFEKRAWTNLATPEDTPDKILAHVLGGTLAPDPQLQIQFMARLEAAMHETKSQARLCQINDSYDSSVATSRINSPTNGTTDYMAKVASLYKYVDLGLDVLDEEDSAELKPMCAEDFWRNPDMDLTEKYKDYDERLEAYELMNLRITFDNPLARKTRSDEGNWHEKIGKYPEEANVSEKGNLRIPLENRDEGGNSFARKSKSDVGNWHAKIGKHPEEANVREKGNLRIILENREEGGSSFAGTSKSDKGYGHEKIGKYPEEATARGKDTVDPGNGSTNLGAIDSLGVFEDIP